MKKACCLLLLLLAGCSADTAVVSSPTPSPQNTDPQNPENPSQRKYLALGDSYTYGQSVCTICRFPEQLKSGLAALDKDVSITMFAVTGWTTSDLLAAIGSPNFDSDYALATLLIGVNNQYQHKPFSLYQTEFPALVNKAIAAVGGDANKVVVLSIPDYAYTPYGQSTSNPAQISQELDQYNAFAQQYCLAHNISFLNITDITRNGIAQPNLVAPDGLHPSEEAYRQFVVRLLPIALQKLP